MAAFDLDLSCGFPDSSLTWIFTSLSGHQFEKSVYEKKRGNRAVAAASSRKMKEPELVHNTSEERATLSEGAQKVGTGKNGRRLSRQKGTESIQTLVTSPVL